MFGQALEEALAPRLRLAGDSGSLAKFGDFLSGRTLEKGTSVVLLYRVEGVLEAAVLPPGQEEGFAQARSEPQASFCLGTGPPPCQQHAAMERLLPWAGHKLGSKQRRACSGCRLALVPAVLTEG